MEQEATDSLLDRLPPDEQRALRAAARRRKFAKGEVVFHEGDPGDALHLVVRGHVAIRVTTPMGETATLTVLGSGDSFGEQALLTDDARRTASAIALDDVETLSIGADQFAELRDRQPVVDRLLVDVLAQWVRRLSAHLLEALYVDADTRVFRRVLMLTDAYRSSGDGSTVLPFTQDDVATMAGTTRPTVNRALKAAEEDGVVTLGRGKITVVDRDALAARTR